MKNMIMALALVSFVTLSACGGCKKKEVTTEVAAPVVPAPEAPKADVAAVLPATEQAPK